MTIDRIRRQRAVLDRDGPGWERSPGDFERVSIGSTDADALRDLIDGEAPRLVIEVGLAYGVSTLAIGEAIAAHDGRMIVIDAHQDEYADVGWRHIIAAGLRPRVTLLRERSQLALPRLLERTVTADAAFVDGSHHFHNVFLDLTYLGEIVRPSGLVVLDDHQWPSVAAAVSYFERNLGWTSHEIAAPTRLRAFRLPDPPVRPDFTEFQPFGAPVR